MIVLTWPDGSRLTAPSWEAMEERISEVQWTPLPKWRMRRELARRALVWNGERVPVWGSSERFLRRLSAAGLFDVR